MSRIDAVQGVRRLRRVTRIIISALAALIIIAAAVIFILYRNDITDAHARLDGIDTKVFASKYGDIEYKIAGEGPTVLISHGVTGGIDQGMALGGGVFDQFGGAHRFLYVSRFGYLKSDMPKDASAQMQAAAYKELLDHLGIKDVFVYGNSAGAPSAMWFAIDYPGRTKGLILSSSAVPTSDPITSPPAVVFESDFVYWAIVKAVPGVLLDLFVPKELTLTPKEKKFFAKNVFEASLPVSRRSKGILFDNRVSTPSVNDVPFEKATSPTLIVHAIDDPAPPIEGARDMARRMPKAKLVELEGGHLMVRQEKEVPRLISEFVRNND